MEVKQNKLLALLLNAWILIPVFFYFKMVNEYALNLPYSDDYDAILGFLNIFNGASFSEKISLLFAQHNEHRILSSRIIFILYYKVFGNINFRHLIFIANLQLAALFFVVVFFIKQSIPKYWNLAAFITALCMFDVGNFENANFAMAGMQNYGVILWFAISLFYYSKNTTASLLSAVIFQLLCIFSSGNGGIGSLLITAFTVFSKSRIKMIAGILSSLIFIPLYFFHYSKAAAVAGTNIPDSISYFFQLTGGIFDFDLSLYIGVCIIVLLLICLPVTKKIQFKNNTLPLFCLLLFVLASMATVSFFRSHVQGIHFYTSRYLIYPHLLAGLLFVFGFIRLQGNRAQWPAAIIFLLIMLRTYSHNIEWGQSGFNVEYTRLTSTEYVHPDQKRAKAVSEESCRQGIYCIEDGR